MMKKLALAICLVMLAAPGVFAAEPAGETAAAMTTTIDIASCPAAPAGTLTGVDQPAVIPAGGNPQCPSCNHQSAVCFASCDGLVLFECAPVWPCDYTCECYDF